MRFDASALVSVSSKRSPVSCASVSRYERCAAVMGSSPVFHSSGSFFSAGWFRSDVCWSAMREEKAKSAPRTELNRREASSLLYAPTRCDMADDDQEDMTV